MAQVLGCSPENVGDTASDKKFDILGGMVHVEFGGQMLGQIGELLRVILSHFLERFGDELETPDELIFADVFFQQRLDEKFSGENVKTAKKQCIATKTASGQN